MGVVLVLFSMCLGKKEKSRTAPELYSYIEYKYFPNLQQLVAEIPWNAHHGGTSSIVNYSLKNTLNRLLIDI